MRKIIAIAVVFIILAFSSCVYAFDFSADVVSRSAGQRMTGKIAVSKDKVRMDMGGMTTISRMDKMVSWVIMPNDKMYMEQPIDMSKTAGASEKMPGEIERVSLGPETVDGRATIKYRVVYIANGVKTSMLQWIDNQTNIPVKTAAEDGTWSMEYKNLKSGAQDSSLFEVPAGYSKFAMPDMGDMMKSAMKNARE